MTDLFKDYIGKQCVVCTLNGSSISGTITDVESNWIKLKRNDITEIINIEYVSRIYNIPLNKKGKPKAIY